MPYVIACRHGTIGRCYECHPRTIEEAVFSMDRVTAGPTVDGLIALLRQAEWSGGDIPACPWCGRTLSRTKGSAESHAPDCPVAPILYPKEQG